VLSKAETNQRTVVYLEVDSCINTPSYLEVGRILYNFDHHDVPLKSSVWSYGVADT